MENARQQIVDAIKSTDNILVTVSSNPTVDELSAALGLTIILNNLDKRASAVFSGLIPPAISFLEPNKTFEPTAGSLRDFIIALDKEKADHLRYKVEGDVVKIFITPYRRMLTEKDLVFSQGDYNVELVIALGVTDQNHLDKALDAQGKILHSASIITVSSGQTGSTLGSLDWHDATASSLSEMIVGLSDLLKMDKPLLDQQIATALLTGIVSATDRFSNDKTTSRSMTMAAQLMAAGANQQLIAAKLEEAHDIAPGPTVMGGKVKSSATKPQDNTLTIDRSEKVKKDTLAGVNDVSDGNKLKNDIALESSLKIDPTVTEEESHQKELENDLQNITTQPAVTLADIEAQLHKESTQQQLATSTMESAQNEKISENSLQPEQQNALKENSIIDKPNQASQTITPNIADLTPNQFPELVETSQQYSGKPTGNIQSAPPLQEVRSTKTDTNAFPSIESNHGTYSVSAINQPLINGSMNGPYDGEPPTIDPFAEPVVPLVNALDQNVKPQTVTPIAQFQSIDSNNIQPQGVTSSPPQSLGFPELPPLPPLPPKIEVQPLPPLPPPPVVFNQQPNSVMPESVPGDFFADGVVPQASLDVSQQQQDKPPGPGQFRIPGSPS